MFEHENDYDRRDIDDWDDDYRIDESPRCADCGCHESKHNPCDGWCDGCDEMCEFEEGW